MISTEKSTPNWETSFKFLDDEIPQLTEAERLLQQQLQHQQQQQEYLTLYRQSLVRLQKEDPEAAARMPGLNALELEEREKDILENIERINYSKRYADLTHLFRHVILPKNIAKWIPAGRLMKEAEWRTLGVTQSPGWTHYLIHEPEPHILLFKRPLNE